MSARVFWDPHDCAHVLFTEAELADPARAFPPFDLSAFSCGASVLLAPDGCQHVLLKDECRSLQLAVSGPSVLRPSRLSVDAMVSPRRLKFHLNALQCLNDLSGSGSLKARYFPPEPRAQRLRVVVQALDGWLAGASHREIAIALFRQSRVNRDWADPRGHLRDQVRRAIRRGRYLMDGGYRQFLG